MMELCLVVLIITLSTHVEAQFPRVCAPNATLPKSTCCPSMPEDPTGPICGGLDRGRCQHTMLTRNLQKTMVSEIVMLDDRLDWPNAFFRYTCKCNGNFWGYACHRCRPGWTGKTCQTRAVRRIRRNALTMSKQQKQAFRDILSMSKNKLSDWVALNISSSSNGDPISRNNVKFYNVSVYNYIVHTHYYAARSTLLSTSMSKCPTQVHTIDAAHKGSVFLAWHRFFLMEAEYQLDRIRVLYNLSSEPFAFPYWDWVGKSNCSVCTNDLIGALNTSDPNSRLDSRSTFYNWTLFCERRVSPDVCHTCDPTRKYEYIWRSYSTDPSVRVLPKQEQIDFIMNLTTYDTYPYNFMSDSSSFRNNIEGFVSRDNKSDINNDYMHNLVHMYMNGSTNDVTGSPNDPLFWLHHSFIDKIFEFWMRKHKINYESISVNAGPLHSRYDPLVPFFPQVLHKEAMATSDNLGFDYDNDYLGVKRYPSTATKLRGTLIMLILVSLAWVLF